MDKFETFSGIAAPMPLVNIDTDMIIPKQFLKTIKRSGLGVHAFDEMRYDDDGNEIPDFVLNQSAYREASILIAGDNFGCGSSREHAPWALSDFGIKVVVSTSFADIFFNNCFKNGILPIRINEEIVLELAEYSKRKEEIEIDLENQEIKFGNKNQKFDSGNFLFRTNPEKVIYYPDEIDVRAGWDLVQEFILNNYFFIEAFISSLFILAMLSSDIPFGHSTSQAPVLEQFPNPSKSI